MKYWKLVNVKNPIWFIFGLITVFLAIGVTTFFMLCGPGPITLTGEVDSVVSSGISGRFGTVTESLGRGLFVLSYESITGNKDDLQLQDVTGQLRELQTTWDMSFPSAKKVDGVWTLFGPLNLKSIGPNGKTATGKGSIANNGPALKWDQGIWYGLSPMVWNDLSCQGRGKWTLPAGWYRDLIGRLVVENGPVCWLANKGGDILSMDANKIRVDLDFQEGRMEDVTANLVGGCIKAKVVDIDKNYVNWYGPVSFVRDDGWHGSSDRCRTPRSLRSGSDIEKVELNLFQAKREAIGGVELVSADHAKWTKAGLLLEGNARLEQPLDGKIISLQASKIFQRSGLGGDFSPDMPVGAIWAGPQAVMFWDAKSLISSHHIEGIRKTRQWSISAPANGRWENVTFTAGEGRGNPARWAFNGPISANLGDGFVASGDSLLWEGGTFTLVGRPVSLNRSREKLTGRRLVLRKKVLEFQEGVVGALMTADEDINIKADRGKILRTLINLYGQVECVGRYWRLRADSVSVTIGAGNIVKQVNGSGSVFFSGQMGEGRGDAISLDLCKKTADWLGKVKAIVGTSS